MARQPSPAALLDRQVYALWQVDSLLGLTSGTAKRWLEGYSRGGRFYDPVIREAPLGIELATWGEFVEAGLLAAYRHKDIPMQRMRATINVLREKSGKPYPLAHYQPLVANRELVLDAQDATKLQKGLQLVVVRNDQLMLTPEAKGWVEKIEWFENEVAGRLYPVGIGSKVVIDPELRFGEPNVKGISTENLAELFEAGDAPDEIARTYNLDRSELDDAIRFELSRRAA